MKFKRRKIKRGRVEVIPMIDLIVILLVFYMTFSRFVQAQRTELTLPKSKAGDDYRQKEGQLVINMLSTDAVIIDQQRHRTSDLPVILNRIKASDPKYKNLSVILRGSKTMKYEDLSDFMKACSKAGIADVTFATIE